MAKKLLVKDVLNVMHDDVPVNCVLYAYGIYYASSWDDGMKNVAECKDGMRYDCLNAKVTNICASEQIRVVIHAEIIY